MKTESELKEEIEELKKKRKLSSPAEYQRLTPYIKRLEAQLQTLQQRNAEVKQAIDKEFKRIEKASYGQEFIDGFRFALVTLYLGLGFEFDDEKKELLQKLGLEK